jgi:hypothetical protein
VALSNRSYTLRLTRSYASTENIQPGCYRATAADHFTPDCTQATSLHISGASLSGKNVGLSEGLVITGAVKNRAGGGDLCAYVDVTRVGSPGATGYANACGGFNIDGLAPGHYTLRVFPGFSVAFVPGFYSSGNANQWVSLGGTPTTISLSANQDLGTINPSNGHTIYGHIYDKNGAALEDIYVDVATTGGHFVGTDTTVADGSYSVAGVPNGTYVVSVHPFPGTNLQSGWFDGVATYGFAPHRSQATPITVSADTFGIDMRVPDGFTISGRITDPGGHGVQAAVIGVGPGAPTSSTHYSSADGTYQLVGFAAGSYKVDVIPLVPSTLGLLARGWYSATAPHHYTKARSHATAVPIGP